MQQQVFEKYFSLEEAVSAIPFVKQTFATAYDEMDALRDEVILYKRMHQIQEEEQSLHTSQDQALILEALHQKWHVYEECFYRWVNVLMEEGIQVRDFKKGLIDFPYRSSEGKEYFLCWQLGEDGLFYFHDVYEGYGGRKPISLLPD